MSGIIKGGLGFGYVTVPVDDLQMKTVHGDFSEPASNMRTVLGRPPEIEEEEEPQQDITEEEQADEGGEQETEKEYISREEAMLERDSLIEEYERLRERYERESEHYVIRAREKAAEIYDKTQQMAHEIMEKARAEAQQIKKDAAEEGRNEGYEAGYQNGHEEGYVSALKKCKDTLLELKAANEAIVEQKEQIFIDYEHQLFDTIFEIAQKITVNSLKRNDRAAITKMLREAAKRYRNSKSVKITLSAFDVSEEAEIDEEIIKGMFSDSTNVEIEILNDAPQGTLIIDNGAEITDAGVQTQLKMIEQLGKGKYRDKTLTDLLRDKKEKGNDNEQG